MSLQASVNKFEIIMLQKKAQAWKMMCWRKLQGASRGCWWFSFKYWVETMYSLIDKFEA